MKFAGKLFLIFFLFFCKNDFAQNNFDDKYFPAIQFINSDERIFSRQFIDFDEQIFFRENPAFVIFTGIDESVKIIPDFEFSKNDYRRKFDPFETTSFNIGFLRSYKINERSVFSGFANYKLSEKKDSSGNIERDPYSGDVFYFTDSTYGITKTNSPSVSFNYSYLVLKNLSLGVSIKYLVENSLKNSGSYASTVFREVAAGLGIIWKISDRINFGGNFIYSDKKENVDFDNPEGTQIQFYNFRGDKFFIKELFDNSFKTFLTKNYLLNNHFTIQLNEKFTIGSAFNYEMTDAGNFSRINIRADKPESKFDQNKMDYRFLLLYKIKDNILTSLKFERKDSKGISILNERNLLISEFKLRENKISGGLKFDIEKDKHSLSIEISGGNFENDSLKYIDGRFIKIKSKSGAVKILAENKLGKTGLNFGYGFQMFDNDPFIGGLNAVKNTFVLNYGFQISEKFRLSGLLNYNNINAEFSGGIKSVDEFRFIQIISF